MENHQPHPSAKDALRRIRQEEMEDIARRKAEAIGLPYVDLLSLAINLEALKLIPEDKARAAGAVVFQKRPKSYDLAAEDPANLLVQDLIKTLKKFGQVQIFIASPQGLEKFWHAYQLVPKEREQITGIFSIPKGVWEEIKKIGDKLEGLRNFLSASQELDISQILAWLFTTAIFIDASDIHLEAGAKQTLLRLRLDGILWPVFEFPPTLASSLQDRIKLLSGLKLNVRNIPQDGRFTIGAAEEVMIENRVSTIPGPDGENLVIRLLNPKLISFELENLGLRQDDLAIIDSLLRKPNGLIVVTGPTGSGKTTTLYAALKKILSPGIKIITIEDPIEYHLLGIEQTQVNAAEGYNFANGLKAILRQDPDVILVGEIRDFETAEAAIHASLTGHLVFTTLHTNDAPGTIPRLIDLGAKPAILAPAINLAVAQRLVRRLCQHCAKSIVLDAQTAAKFKGYLDNLPSRTKKVSKIFAGEKIKQAVGCAKCAGAGYKGRVGVFELFLVDDEMETLIHTSPTESAIRQLAKAQGMVTMMQDALLKVLEGITDVAEVERMVGPI